MGIDRIGKGGAPPAAPETQGSGSVEKKGSIEKAFSVERPDATKQAWQAGAAEAAQGSQALARLRAGEIDVDGYVDLKVDEATRGLEGLSPAELEDIKKVLRDQMSTDPGLVDLVRTATGQTPKIPED
ncbi:MAG: hypothetical protein BGO98_35605 [Myxococcales bacterium 68-20]|nr:MAG: hypothetical protein BGO98_35605 [Myxococcales bacterium 68-20]